VVDSSLKLHAKLHKQHTMLSFHYVREAIASGIVGFFYIPGLGVFSRFRPEIPVSGPEITTKIPGDVNPAYILSKHGIFSNQRTPEINIILER
jgi:hypothetical protein